MKYVEVKEMSSQELLKSRKSFREELFQMKMKNSLGQLGSPIEIRFLRRKIARINTAIAAKAHK